MRALALIVSLLSASVFAADIPQSSSRDNRIQYVNYDPADVVVIHSQVGIASRVVLEQGESIVSVHTGFSDGWNITGAGRIMTVQPVPMVQDQVIAPDPDLWTTNIAVETDQRLYDFEVRLLPENYSGDERAFYRIEFRYPLEAEKQARQLASKKQSEQAVKPALPRPKSFAYEMRLGKNSKGIAPTMAYNDGLFTYLKFPANRDFPAVFIRNTDGSEGMINTHVHEEQRDILVVQRVAPVLLLRLGQSVIEVINTDFDSHGIPPVNGSADSNIRREIRGES